MDKLPAALHAVLNFKKSDARYPNFRANDSEAAVEYETVFDSPVGFKFELRVTAEPYEDREVIDTRLARLLLDADENILFAIKAGQSTATMGPRFHEKSTERCAYVQCGHVCFYVPGIRQRFGLAKSLNEDPVLLALARAVDVNCLEDLWLTPRTERNHPLSELEKELYRALFDHVANRKLWASAESSG